MCLLNASIIPFLPFFAAQNRIKNPMLVDELPSDILSPEDILPTKENLENFFEDLQILLSR